MSELLLALNSVQSQISHLCTETLKPKSSLLKRSKAVTAFQNAEIVVDQQIEVVTSIPSKPRNIKRDLKKLKNLLQAIHTGIESKELDPLEVKSTVIDNILPVMSSLVKVTLGLQIKHERSIAIDTEIDLQLYKYRDKNSSKGSTDSFADLAYIKAETERLKIEFDDKYKREDQSVTSNKLISYKTYEETFVQKDSDSLSELQTQGNCLPVMCPIFVSFVNSRLRELNILESMGFKATPISSRENDHADVALILEDQILIQFSKKAARQSIINSYTEERKVITSSNLSKNVRKHKTRLKKAEKELASLSTKSKSSSLLKMVVQQQKKLEKEIESLLENIKRDILLLKHQRHRIVVSQRETLAKSNIKNSEGRKKVMLKPKALAYHINGMLKKFADAGKNYSLISSDFIPHPNLPDICFAWIVPIEQAQYIRTMYSDSNVVTSWGFPWKVDMYAKRK
jgi:hypothetical protein